MESGVWLPLTTLAVQRALTKRNTSITVDSTLGRLCQQRDWFVLILSPSPCLKGPTAYFYQPNYTVLSLPKWPRVESGWTGGGRGHLERGRGLSIGLEYETVQAVEWRGLRSLELLELKTRGFIL